MSKVIFLTIYKTLRSINLKKLSIVELWLENNLSVSLLGYELFNILNNKILSPVYKYGLLSDLENYKLMSSIDDIGNLSDELDILLLNIETIIKNLPINEYCDLHNIDLELPDTLILEYVKYRRNI